MPERKRPGRPLSKAKAPTDWTAVRLDYEASMASLRTLCKRHGISSENSIRRKRDAEGWVRDEKAITRQLITTAVADREAEDVRNSGNVRSAHITSLAPAHICAHDSELSDQGFNLGQNGLSDLASNVRSERPESSSGPARDPDVRKTSRAAARTAQREADDQALLRRAGTMAQVSARAISDQLASADKLDQIGNLMQGHLVIHLSSDDVGEKVRALNRLVPTEKDTLAKTVDAMTKMFLAAAAMRRKALGLDNVLDTPTPEAKPEAEVDALLSNLSESALMELREITLQASRLRPEMPKTIDHEDEP